MGSIFSSFISFAHQKQQYRYASLPLHYEQAAVSICTTPLVKKLAADPHLLLTPPSKSTRNSQESSKSFKLSLDLNLNLTSPVGKATAYTCEGQQQQQQQQQQSPPQHKTKPKAKQTKVNSRRATHALLLQNVLASSAQQQQQQPKALDSDESVVKVRVKVSDSKSSSGSCSAGTAQAEQTQEHRQREQKNKDNNIKAAIATSTMKTKMKTKQSSKTATKNTRTSCIPELDGATTTTTIATINFDNFRLAHEKHVDLTCNSTVELTNKRMTILPNITNSSSRRSQQHHNHNQNQYHHQPHQQQNYHQSNHQQAHQQPHQLQHMQQVQNRNARSAGKPRTFHNKRISNRSPCSSALSSCSVSSTGSSSRSSSSSDHDEFIALNAARFTLDPRFRLPPTQHAYYAWAMTLDGPAMDHPSRYPEPPERPWIHKRLNKQQASITRGQQQVNQPEFTALSYNVLCDRMVSSESFPASPEMALSWFYRRELILRQLLEYEPDIIALQELELEQYETFFKPRLEKMACYGSIFEPKSRAKTMDNQWRRRVDGCAIFFKAEKFILIQSHLLEFSQIAMANAQGSEAMLNRVMTKDNIGLVAVLEFTQQKQRQRLLVCNTHIHWDPECCDVKLIQTIMLMNELECIAKQNSITASNCRSPGSLISDHPYTKSNDTNNPSDSRPLLPLVLLGDFNSMPNSGVTSYLTAGKIDSLHKDFKNFKYTTCSNVLAASDSSKANDDTTTATNTFRRQSSPAWCYYNQHYQQLQSATSSPGSSPLSLCSSISSTEEPPVLNYNHPFKLASSYEKDVMPYTNYTTTFKAVIDYIFYSRESIQLVGLLGPLDKNWLKGNRIKGLPQVHIPSDHLPLLVKLRITSTLSHELVNLSLPPKLSRRVSNYSIKQNFN